MKDPLWMKEDWKADCQRYIGQTLMGRFAHWCHDWDGLPVDETCDEFDCCKCWEATPELEQAHAALAQRLHTEQDSDAVSHPLLPP